MSITLYTAPNCIRCKIVKAWLDEKSIPYGTLDYKADADAFNAFYRANRKHMYRNPEGVEFPIFQKKGQDGADIIRQGTGLVLAYLLSENGLDGCVTRSDLLHGWIAGLYPSQCPTGQEDAFVTLVERMAQGGLRVCLRVDGRRPELLQRLLESGHVQRVELGIPGPQAVYERLYGSAPAPAELARSIALARGQADHQLRLDVAPVPEGDAWRWPTPEETAQAAQMAAAACGNHKLPVGLRVARAEDPQGLHGLDAAAVNPLKYRQAARGHLYKTDIIKA